MFPRRVCGGYFSTNVCNQPRAYACAVPLPCRFLYARFFVFLFVPVTADDGTAYIHVYVEERCRAVIIAREPDNCACFN